MVVHVLAVADEVVEGLLSPSVSTGSGARPDLGPVAVIVACGDLPFDYLEALICAWDAPLVFVPGNHDPDLSGYRIGRSGLELRAGLPTPVPWPPGSICADGRVVHVAGLRIAGLGGSPRYRDGPNQYTQRGQRWRAGRLAVRSRLRCTGTGIDLLLTHAPPRGCGDAPDLPHVGFDALHPLVTVLRPRQLLHGHVHPYGSPTPDRTLGVTAVRNVIPYRHLGVPPVRPTDRGERRAA